MTPSLERLTELVRQAEAKTRVNELSEQLRHATEHLREAEERIRVAEAQAREVKPRRLRDLEQAETDEQQLKELRRKAAMLKSKIESGKEVEQLIDQSQLEIDVKRREAQAELDTVARALDEARRDVRNALEKYQQLRRELDRLQLKPNGVQVDDERLVDIAEAYFPEYQVRAFSREIEDGAGPFGMLDRREQYAQMKIWIGRLRRFQAVETPEDERDLLEQVFRRLVGLSKQYEPGYIEAFNRQFVADWDKYVADAQEALQQVTDEVRRGRMQHERMREQQEKDDERKRVARDVALEAKDELKGILTRYDLPNEGVDEFRAALRRAVDGLGADDEDLVNIAREHRELIGGPEFRNLRRVLELAEEAETRLRDIEETREQYQDLIGITRGKSAMMIGGAQREESRRLLQRTFEFAELEWVPYQDNRPALMDSLEQRVRNGGFDMVILLLGFIGHHVSNTFRPLCEEVGVPCIMVGHGYGASQLAEALRRVFPRGEEVRTE